MHSYMLLAGFGTDAVVVYYQYVFVWHVDPGKEKCLQRPQLLARLPTYIGAFCRYCQKIAYVGEDSSRIIKLTGVESTLIFSCEGKA
jgi:hypothetical protein